MIGNRIETFLTSWQAIDPGETSYPVFLHLIESAGNIVDQVDRLPRISSNLFPPDQGVTDQHHLTPPQVGRYQLTLGPCDPTTGIRLPMFSADRTQYPDDQYLVERTVP